MKKISQIIVALVIVSVMVLMANYSIAADRLASVSAAGTKAIVPGALLDDFRYAAPINVWNAPTGTFSSSAVFPPPSDANCIASYESNTNITFGGSGYSLKLNYNVSAANSFSGYYSYLGSASVSTYKALSFWVKGAAGGEFFKIQLKNTSGGTRNTAAIYVTDYLDGGVTTGWQKVTIPFYNFGNLDGFTSMAEFTIVFENSQSGINGSLPYGTIYIDDIRFDETTQTTARVDHYGDKIGTCALGGNIGMGVGGGASESLNRYDFVSGSNEYSPYPNGMKLTYNVTSGWSYVFILFGGGSDGWTALPQNLSAFNYLNIRIRARSEAENPKYLKLEIADGTGAKFVVLEGITTSWQYWHVPLSEFTGLDKSTIKQITFVFEDWRISSAGGSKSGVIYIDSVQFDVN